MAETKSEVTKKPMSTGAKVLIGCGGLFILMIIGFIGLSALGIAGISKVAEEVNNQQQQEEKKNDDAFTNPAKLNEKVTVGEVEWTVTKAQDLGSKLKTKYPSFDKDCVANSGKFIKVYVSIKNNSKEMVSVTDLDLLDSQKREYKTSSEVSSCIEDELFILDNINPGIKKTFVGVYEVPKDASGFRLKVGDLNLFSSKESYIGLGF